MRIFKISYIEISSTNFSFTKKSSITVNFIEIWTVEFRKDSIRNFSFRRNNKMAGIY